MLVPTLVMACKHIEHVAGERLKAGVNKREFRPAEGLFQLPRHFSFMATEKSVRKGVDQPVRRFGHDNPSP